MSITIKNNHQYKASYDSSLLRGIDDPHTPRPWDIIKLIRDASNGRHNLLDIGCGTAFKTIKLAPYFDKIVAIDPSDSMQAQAKQNISIKNISNITVLNQAAENISAIDCKFDVITAMLARFNPSQIHQSLNKQGVVIIEHIGCEDKLSFKRHFGQDKSGWRGQLMHYNTDEYLQEIEQSFKQYFKNVDIQNGYWDTFYTREGIYALLNNTPTIRNFSSDDYQLVDKVIALFSKENGVKLRQNRILIYAKHPRLL